jgi:hypothetical protein
MRNVVWFVGLVASAMLLGGCGGTSESEKEAEEAASPARGP